MYEGSDVVYLGKTTALTDRLNSHFKKQHPEWKGVVDKIEICKFENEADMNIQEIYQISKLKPKFNKDCMTKDFPSYKLPELDFRELTGWN